MGSFDLFLLLLTFFSLSSHCSPSRIIQAAIHQDPKAYHNCTTNTTFAANSTYQSNIRTLLDWLSSNGTSNVGSYNTTVASKNTADTVYGFFYCFRDANPKGCQQCVIEAAKLISSLCTMAKEAIIWYQVCIVHYSNHHFFSTLEESPKISFMNDQDYVGQVGRFNNILWCAPYLSMENCSWCLSDGIAEITNICCRGKSGGTVIYPICAVRFELYPFHMTESWVSPPPLPSRTRPSAPPGFVAMIIPH